MDEGQAKQENLLDTTDCLEAVGVLRAWKNFSFVIVVLSLLILQILFWVVNLGLVKAGNETVVAAKTGQPAVAGRDTVPAANSEPTETEATADDEDVIREAAEKVIADLNLPAAKAPKKSRLLSAITFERLAWLIRFLNFVSLLAATLYCLTMLFSLKVSLLGRLGGINHICRAFFLSLTFLVLLLPWQVFFGPVVKGAIYTPDNLLAWVSWRTAETSGIFVAALHYLRFTGYWLLVMLLLVFSLLRSSRWTKATLRRLEVV